MSKEFEELWDAAHKVSKMQQPVALVNAFKSLCEEFFTAGRALGRSEMKGEAKAEVRSIYPACGVGTTARKLLNAIEAIPEEV